MRSAAPGSLVTLVVGDPLIENGLYLGTSEDQRILIGYKVLDQIFEAAMWSERWPGSGLGSGMGFGIDHLVACGVVMDWGIESSPM